MKFYKTSESKRTTYTYGFTDGSTFTLVPGENGVTELDIKNLHRLDDCEVENNIKNSKPVRSEKEKEEIEEWTVEYVQNFEEKYGYTPNKVDLMDAVKRRFPKNWTQSLDEVEEELGDKSTLMSPATDSPADEQISFLEQKYQVEIEARIEELLKGLSPRDMEIYRRVVVGVNGKPESCISVATELGISDSYVSRVAKRIKAIIASDEILKKLHR